ncbi:hypothetical protein G6F56_011356 [Rhizopus delemar]|nr:hypothetical protein G6F56_011356 [Rhizopus delemar]
MKLFLAATLLSGLTTVLAECQNSSDKKAVDECYMKIALDYALFHNPRFPFGALIVNHKKNQISCYGANANTKNKLLHGETSAFWNCTELYPSPTNNDMTDPGLDWSDQTLYTTGEPSGREQITIRMQEVIQAAKLGANIPNHRVPVVEGGVLKDKCDHAFWCAFAPFRNEFYHSKMIRDGYLDYIKDRQSRFKCSRSIAHEEL